MRNYFDVEHAGVSTAEWKAERLHSWKEVASFFGKEVRTVQLWEKSEGLPVRRHQHKKQGSVYAYRHELEAWRRERSTLSARSASQVQPELARGAVQAIPGQVACGEPCHCRMPTTESNPAYHACMMGTYFWKQRTRRDLIKALRYFQDAIDIDPSYADAYAGLTDTYVALSYNHAMPARAAAAAGHSALARAKLLDPGSLNVRKAEINFETNCSWDWPAAERAYGEIERSGEADARTAQLYANLMINRGRHDDAVSLALHAYQLDPLSDAMATQVSYAYFYAGDYDNAVSFTKRAIALKPFFNVGHALLGRAESLRGNWDEAIESFERGLALSSDSAVLKALLAYGYAGRGDAPTAYKLLQEIEEQRSDPCFPAVDVSAVYAMLKCESEALRNIARAHELGDMKLTYLRYDPRFNRLEPRARFQHLDFSAYVRANCGL